METRFFILKLGYIVDCFSVTDEKNLHSQDTLSFQERRKTCGLPNATTSPHRYYSQEAERLARPCNRTKATNCWLWAKSVNSGWAWHNAK